MSEPKRALIYATTAYMIDQFNMMNISMLQEMGYEVDAAANFERGNPMSNDRLEAFKKELDEKNVKRYQLPITKNILDIIHNGKALRESIKIMRERKYEFVHCHTPVGAVIARIACRATDTKVIYTAHGFHFFDGAPKLNWMLYYPIEKYFSKMTDVLITINREDFRRARKEFGMKKLEYVPGVGLDTEKFSPAKMESERFITRTEIGVEDDEMMFITVGELNKNKNQMLVLKAFKELESKAAETGRELKYKFCIVGAGRMRDDLQKFITENGLSEKVYLLGYRTDVEKLCKAADVFVFPSIREGLSVALMQAMACELPAVVSRIRGNVDLIRQTGGILFDLTNESGKADASGIEAAISTIMAYPAEKRREMGRVNRGIICKDFSKEAVREKLTGIYTDISVNKE